MNDDVAAPLDRGKPPDDSSVTESEAIFAHYLACNRIEYVRDHPVSASGANVDFLVDGGVLCDVKEVSTPRESEAERRGAYIVADRQIRGDIKKLRKKFDRPPELPVVLVTMNFSGNFFTGTTVVQAMFGAIGWTYSKRDLAVTSPLHHLPRGKAAMTKSQSTGISGVLLYDPPGRTHVLFENPFAAHPVPADMFPDVHRLTVDRETIEENHAALDRLMFWWVTPK